MTTSKQPSHTPGPWHLRGDTVLVNPSLQICQVDRGNKHPDTTKANALLIAAAPELLEALRGMLELLDRGFLAYNTTPGSPQTAAVQQSRAAIAKATGEEKEV